MDSHIVMVKSIDGGWRIAHYCDSMNAAKSFVPTKLKPLDMIVAAPIGAANPAALYDSKLHMSVVDAKRKIMKAPALFEEIGDYKNWIAAWELSDKPNAMMSMCGYVDRKTMVDMACDISAVLVGEFEGLHKNEKYEKFIIAVKGENSIRGKRSIEVPKEKTMPSIINSLINVIRDEEDKYAYSSLRSMLEVAFVYGFVDKAAICDIIRSYVPLPVALLGKRAIK